MEGRAYFANDVARLDVSDGLYKLLDRRIVLAFRVQVVAVLLTNISNA